MKKKNVFLETIGKMAGVVLLILVLCFTACQQPTGSTSRPAATGSITGTARYTGGQDSAGIAITLEQTDGLRAVFIARAASNLRSLNAARAVAGSAVTSADGSYRFADLAPGTYTVYASSQNSKEKAVAVNVNVEAGKSVTVAELKLTPVGSITGKITLDGQSAGNEGFLVFVAGTSWMAVTDSAGNFTISDVPVGNDYQIIVMKGSYTTAVGKQTVSAGSAADMGSRDLKSADINGGGLQWQGSLAAAPENPQVNWAYYDTAEGKSYIWDGSQWRLLAQDGADGADGATGAKGDKGDTGATGPAGQKGADGSPGGDIILQYTPGGSNNLESAFREAVEAAKASGKDGLSEQTALTVRVTGLSLDDDLGMFYLYKAVRGYYVHLDLSGASGETFGYSFLSTNISKEKILSVTLGSAVKTIEGRGASNVGAFEGFTGMKTITAPGVTSIGDWAFYNCGLASIDLPGVTSIGSGAFSSCMNLASVSLPSGITSIGDRVFIGCPSLTDISLPAVTSIGREAFSQCRSLTSINLPIVTSIGEGAFSRCDSLISISFPAVTSIGYEAFSDCRSLTNINLPAVTSIGGHAFFMCNSLTNISLPIVTSIGVGAFYYCQNLTGISFPNVISIDASAFFNCNSLVSISLPSSVTSIGGSAFAMCTSLTTVELGSAAPTLGTTILYEAANFSTGVRTVTVTIPQGAAGYPPAGAYSGNDSAVNWANGFRGKGWDGAAFLNDSINTYITLVIAEQTP
jgi:hypothetical protein